MIWTLTSWIAVALGITSAWLVIRHPTGWLIGIASCTTWIAYNIHLHIWAGVFASIIAALIGWRNWKATRCST